MVDKKTALRQIDLALAKYRQFCKQDFHDIDFEREHTQVVFHLMETLRRLAQRGSRYHVTSMNEHELAGVLQALRVDYDMDAMQTLRELIHGETFTNFLEMASHLLREGYKDAAAVIAGGVLEQHLRALCAKLGVDPAPTQINPLNAALYSANAYELAYQKHILGWSDIRNNAAHGSYSAVDKRLVELMIEGVNHFILKHPA